jgi:hypothetical protein
MHPHTDTGAMPSGRKRYTVAELVAMQGAAPLIVDVEWDTMTDAGMEALGASGGIYGELPARRHTRRKGCGAGGLTD